MRWQLPHAQLVSAGIESPSDAARALKVPNSVEIPRWVMTTSGPFIVDHLANSAVQSMQLQNLITPPQPPPSPEPKSDDTEKDIGDEGNEKEENTDDDEEDITDKKSNKKELS